MTDATALAPSLQVVRPHHVDDLVRVGRDHDGGYVLPSRLLQASQLLVGLGINTDWSFESAFLERSAAKVLIAVDGSVGALVFARRAVVSCFDLAVRVVRRNRSSIAFALRSIAENVPLSFEFAWFFSRPDRHFVAKMLGRTASADMVTWAQLRERFPRVNGAVPPLFIKMDIEGAEYDVLPLLLTFEDDITGIVIEFHDLDTRWPDFVAVVEQLKRKFCIVHVHGNNYRQLIGGTDVPSVLELTFLSRNAMTPGEIGSWSTRQYPLDILDQANDTATSDYPLRF